jgi:hypothetical protein
VVCAAMNVTMLGLSSSLSVFMPCSANIHAAPGRSPYSENTVHLFMCVDFPFASLNTLQPYTAAFGGVYTEHCKL